MATMEWVRELSLAFMSRVYVQECAQVGSNQDLVYAYLIRHPNA